MVADVTLKPECQRSRPSPVGAPRSPILLLEDAGGNDVLPRYGDLIAARSVHAVVREQSAATSVLRFPFAGDAALGAWHRLQNQFETSCIGLVAEPASGIAGACRIFEECRVDGTWPGAIALLGFSQHLVATCVSLARALETPNGSKTSAATAGGIALAALFEWPPMVIFLPEDDPSIGASARACRDMLSLGIPIRLEVMRSVRGTASGLLSAFDELVGEMDRFFANHLTSSFPKLL